jgi:hypothetical protein
MIRVLHLLATKYKVAEFHPLWTQILNIASYENTEYKGGLAAVLQEPTRIRYIQSRVTTDMEKQLSFMMLHVKMGNQRRYQQWFQLKFLNTPESEILAVDLIRYICDVFQPPVHVNANFVARWAIMGWIVKSIKNHFVLEQVYWAIIWDWLYCNRNENAMCLEPTMLLMLHSIPKYVDITAHVLNMLFHGIEHALLPPDQVSRNVVEAMRTIYRFGIGGVDRLVDCNLLDPLLREKIKKLFGSFLQGNPQQQLVIPPPSPTSQPFSVPAPVSPVATLPPVSPTNPIAPPFVPPTTPPKSVIKPVQSPVKKPSQPPPTSPLKVPAPFVVEPSASPTPPPSSRDTPMTEEEQPQTPPPKEQQSNVVPAVIAEGDIDPAIKNILSGFITSRSTTEGSEFDANLEAVGRAFSDYIQNNSEVNKKKADEAIVRTLEAYEKAPTLTEGATQQLATVMVRLLGFEFSVLQQEEHTNRVLVFCDETLTWTLLDHISKILMPALGQDKVSAQSQQTQQQKQKQPTRRPKGTKQLKERFSAFLRHACVAEPSMGYRVLCYCIKKFQLSRMPILEKTTPYLTCALMQMALSEQSKGAYTFYEYLVHVRKVSPQQQQHTPSVLTPSIFLSDIKSVIHENQYLFVTLLPIIARDFTTYVKRIKLPLLRLIAGLSPVQVSDIVGMVESGLIKIIFINSKRKPPQQQLEDLDPVKEIMDLLEKAWVGWKDFFELETLWEMVLAEIYAQQTEQYTEMLMKRVKQRDRQEKGLDDDNDDDNDSDELEIDKGTHDEEQEVQIMNLDMNNLLMTLLTSDSFRDNMTACSLNKLQSMILRLAAFIQQQEQRLGLAPSSAQHLLNYDCVKCLVTLPHDVFHHFGTVLLHQYMQFNQQAEQFFITLIKAYDDEPTPILAALAHMRQLEMIQSKIHPNLNRGARSRGLFSNDRFNKQLVALKDKWKKRGGGAVNVLLAQIKPKQPPQPPTSAKKDKATTQPQQPSSQPPQQRKLPRRQKRRKLPWDEEEEEEEDDFIVGDDEEIEAEENEPQPDHDDDEEEDEEEEAEQPPPESPDDDEYRDSDEHEDKDDHTITEEESTNRRSKRVSRRRVIEDEETSKPRTSKRKRQEEDQEENQEEEEDEEDKKEEDSGDDAELRFVKRLRKASATGRNSTRNNK